LGLPIGDVGMFYGHLVYLTAIWYFCGHLVFFVAPWYILWPFGIFFSVLVCLDKEKSGNPGLNN
jgi:hypothetical protein